MSLESQWQELLHRMKMLLISLNKLKKEVKDVRMDNEDV